MRLLHFDHNQIRYLEEEVWKPILLHAMRIYLEGLLYLKIPIIFIASFLAILITPPK